MGSFYASLLLYWIQYLFICLLSLPVCVRPYQVKYEDRFKTFRLYITYHLGTRLLSTTCIPFRGPIDPTFFPIKVSIPRHVGSSLRVGSASDTSYRWKNRASRIRASIIAKFRPMHERGMKVKGAKR